MARSGSVSMAAPKELRIGAKLPNLIGSTQVGVVRAYDYLDGAWGVLCTFPQVPHPVWATELGMLQKLKDQFDARHCRVLGLHVATLAQQDAFLRDVNETQEVKLSFPILADDSAELSRALGLVAVSAPRHAADLHRLPFSCTIVLDIDLTVRFLSYYPLGVGRNMYEVLRALDAFQMTAFHHVVTPTNWKVNEDVFLEPALAMDDAKRLFPLGFHEIKPYMRITGSPAVDEEK